MSSMHLTRFITVIKLFQHKTNEKESLKLWNRNAKKKKKDFCANILLVVKINAFLYVFFQKNIFLHISNSTCDDEWRKFDFEALHATLTLHNWHKSTRWFSAIYGILCNIFGKWYIRMIMVSNWQLNSKRRFSSLIAF